MIFIHLILGIIFGTLYGYLPFILIGSIFPDIDHLYIIIKNKVYTPKKLIDSIKHEAKYRLRYKTQLVHSLLGLIIFSAIVLAFSKTGAMFFAIAYLSHLMIDWMDIDEKYYLYPFKVKFKGFLPIWSKFEQVVTIVALTAMIIILIK